MGRPRVSRPCLKVYHLRLHEMAAALRAGIKSNVGCHTAGMFGTRPAVLLGHAPLESSALERSALARPLARGLRNHGVGARLRARFSAPRSRFPLAREDAGHTRRLRSRLAQGSARAHALAARAVAAALAIAVGRRHDGLALVPVCHPRGREQRAPSGENASAREARVPRAPRTVSSGARPRRPGRRA